MEPYHRIKYLRKNILKLSQEEFAKKIKMSRSNLGNIETGAVNLTDRVIKDICETFSVSNDWLINGKEPIQIENSTKTNEISLLYDTLTEDNQKYLLGYIHRLLEEQKKEGE